MRPILRFALFAAALAALCFNSGCGEGNCAATCFTRLTVDFSSPVGQPGSYRFQVGNHDCQVDLPTTRSGCGRMKDGSIVGFEFAERAPSGPLNVVVTKDGVEVLRTAATVVTNGSFEVCGQVCYGSSFSVQVPASLAPPPRSPCDLANLSGTYTAATELISAGTCAGIRNAEAVTLDKGLMVRADPACQSQVTAWDPDRCALRSLTTCTSTDGTNTWILAVTDLFGDGATLEGSVEYSRSYQSMCWGSTTVRLSR